MKTEKREPRPGHDRGRTTKSYFNLSQNSSVFNKKSQLERHHRQVESVQVAGLHLSGQRINKDYSALSYPSTITTGRWRYEIMR